MPPLHAVTHTCMCVFLCMCAYHRSDSGWRPSCPCVQSWAGLTEMEMAWPQVPLQLWQISRRSTRSSRNFNWMTTTMTTHHPSFRTLRPSMEQWGMVTWPLPDQRMVTTMTIYRYDGGAAAATEITGQNHLLSVCEASPPHRLHVHRGPMRYTRVLC